MKQSLLFDRFIVDKTHCILVFDHSFDELSFSQSLYEEGGGERDVTVGRKW